MARSGAAVFALIGTTLGAGRICGKVMLHQSMGKSPPRFVVLPLAGEVEVVSRGGGEAHWVWANYFADNCQTSLVVKGFISSMKPSSEQKPGYWLSLDSGLHGSDPVRSTFYMSSLMYGQVDFEQ